MKYSRFTVMLREGERKSWTIARWFNKTIIFTRINSLNINIWTSPLILSNLTKRKWIDLCQIQRKCHWINFRKCGCVQWKLFYMNSYSEPLSCSFSFCFFFFFVVVRFPEFYVFFFSPIDVESNTKMLERHNKAVVSCVISDCIEFEFVFVISSSKPEERDKDRRRKEIGSEKILRQ